MKKSFKIISMAAGCLMALSSCQSMKSYATKNNFNEAGDAVSIQLKPILVLDTLAPTKNDFYRKVNIFTPIMYKDNIISGNAITGIISVNKSTKSVVWKLNLKYGVESSGTLVDGTLYLGALDGLIYSVNAESGQINWKYDTKGEITSQPLVYNGVLYTLNGANSLFSLDAKTGRQLWVYNRQETTTKMTIRGGSRPTYSNGVLYSGFSDGSLVALNAQTGTPQWEVILNKNARFKDVDATPVLDDENIYISSYDDRLYCLSKANGSIVWKYSAGGATAPVLNGQYVFVSGSNGSVVSLNKKTGDLVWKKADIKGIATEPIISKGLIIFGESQGSLKALDFLTGQEKASFDPGRGIMSKPSFNDDNSVYFISGEANLYQVDIVPVTRGMIPYLLN
jgi:outer membrane protein assembly factor BamB